MLTALSILVTGCVGRRPPGAGVGSGRFARPNFVSCPLETEPQGRDFDVCQVYDDLPMRKLVVAVAPEQYVAALARIEEVGAAGAAVEEMEVTGDRCPVSLGAQYLDVAHDAARASGFSAQEFGL